VVAETSTVRDGKELCESLERIPGVLLVELVRVDFDAEVEPC
jgi:hypothetical protein